MTYKVGAAATSVVGAAAVAVPLAVVVVRLAEALAPQGAGAAVHRFKALPHSAAAADHRGATQAVGQWPHDPIGLPADPWRRTAHPAAAAVREQERQCGRVARVVDPVKVGAIGLEEEWRYAQAVRVVDPVKAEAIGLEKELRCAQAARGGDPAKAEAIDPVAGYNLEVAGHGLVEAFDPAMATAPSGPTGPAPVAAANVGQTRATVLTGRTGQALVAAANAGPTQATVPTG
jgi:hypothetical protein